MTAEEDLTPNPSPKERGTKNSNIIEYVIPTAEVSHLILKSCRNREVSILEMTNWGHSPNGEGTYDIVFRVKR